MRQTSVSIGENKFYSENVYRTDSSVFKVFDIKLLTGDERTALNDPGKLIISKKLAEKYFAGEAPLGKTIRLGAEYEAEQRDYIISGVFDDLPHNTHFDLDILLSFDDPNQYGWSYFYLLMNKNTNIEKFMPKLDEYKKKYVDQENWDFVTLDIQPIEDIHLFSHKDREIKQNGSFISVLIMPGIAMIILIMATINFLNINIALLFKESFFLVTNRIFGAERFEIFSLQVIKNLTIISFSLIFAWLLFKLSLPLVENIIGADTIKAIQGSFIITVVLALFIISVTLSSFPAFFFIYRKLTTAETFGGNKNSYYLFNPGKRFVLRKILMVIQFSAVMLMVVFAIFTQLQQNFLSRSEDNKESIIVLKKLNHPIRSGYFVLKNELLKNPLVSEVSASMEAPLDQIMDAVQVNGHDPAGNIMVNLYINLVDDNFFDFYDHEIISGENFPDYVQGKNIYNYIINESGARALGYQNLDEVIGKQLTPSPLRPGIFEEGKVVGVVKDFHFSSKHHKIKPLAFYQQPKFYMSVIIKLNPSQKKEALEYVEQCWEKVNPDYPFDYTFLEDIYDHIYEKEITQSSLAWLFTFIAIIISFMGLYGLTSIITAQRTKEIGIRKVLGVTVFGLIMKYCIEFAWLILISGIISIPIAVLSVDTWLSNFSYRITTSENTHFFVLSFLATAVFILLVVGIKTWFAASKNPVDSIHYE